MRANVAMDASSCTIQIHERAEEVVEGELAARDDDLELDAAIPLDAGEMGGAEEEIGSGVSEAGENDEDGDALGPKSHDMASRAAPMAPAHSPSTAASKRTDWPVGRHSILESSSATGMKRASPAWAMPPPRMMASGSRILMKLVRAQ